ncbi:MAG: pyruvate dehydrogenase (acetyl-transferring) E1 component subunit alpha [Candidatus Sumerlaeia bacterium]|nr:pyruvate dehydrogenase (acetyl-transferring) E1 component subunit alpha [Candidatus Sumerlaeia bacterium]
MSLLINSAAPSKTPAQSIDLFGDPANRDGKFAREYLKHAFPKDKVVEKFREMLLMRRFEERCGQEYRKGKIKGFCHLYIGQEAVASGSIAALEAQDYIITAYRDHAHALARGLSSREVMAELYMKYPGGTKGKGGSMHLFHGKNRFFGGHGIVGGQIPLAAGMAFASAYRNEPAVTVCYFGDAAFNQGVFHESANMASLWNLPVVYICENNQVGMGTLTSRSCAVPDLYRRTAEAYRMDGIRCDGMCVEEMYSVTKEAAERARTEGRPCFIEAITYRYRGHSMSDPATTYRTPNEVSTWEQRDPMLKLRSRHPDLLTDAVVEKLEAEIAAEVEDAVQFSVEADLPPLEEIWTHVYVDCPGYPDASVSKHPYEYHYDM